MASLAAFRAVSGGRRAASELCEASSAKFFSESLMLPVCVHVHQS